MKSLFTGLTLVFSILSLVACAPFSTRDERAGVCNELNSQLIFGGNTSNVRKQSIENASQPKVQQTFDRSNCSQ